MFARVLSHLSLVLVVAFGLGLPAAEATVMIPLSIEEMSKEAAAVVRARVLQQEARWDTNKKRIFTHTKLEIIDPIHRRLALPTIVEVRTLGGEIDGLGMKVAGEARFSAGEQVVVFLASDEKAPGIFRVIGMSQGKFRLDRDPEGRWYATPSLEGLAFAKRDNDGVLRVSEDERADGRISFDDLRRRVLASLEPTTPATPKPVATPPAVHAPASPNATTTP